jgi:hypothetical protein
MPFIPRGSSLLTCGIGLNEEINILDAVVLALVYAPVDVSHHCPILFSKESLMG